MVRKWASFPENLAIVGILGEELFNGKFREQNQIERKFYLARLSSHL